MLARGAGVQDAAAFATLHSEALSTQRWDLHAGVSLRNMSRKQSQSLKEGLWLATVAAKRVYTLSGHGERQLQALLRSVAQCGAEAP